MKKFWIFALAALLVVAFTLPASALESVFGGYWRTRFVTQQNFTGEDITEKLDMTLVDTRSHFYYTAILNDNLKFVNKFEIDAIWGDTAWGDPGADGVDFQVKNSYVDFNPTALTDFNFKVGVMGATLSRGFIWSDDAAGMIVTYNGDNFKLPIVWIKMFEGTKHANNNIGANVKDGNDGDVDLFGIDPVFTINDVKINPTLFWMTSQDLRAYSPCANANSNGQAQALFCGPIPAPVWYPSWAPTIGSYNKGSITDADIFFLGLNADYKSDTWSVWGTFIYETGTVDYVNSWNYAPNFDITKWPPFYVTRTTPISYAEADVDAYLIAFGGKMDYNDVEIHGQFFYATGDEDAGDNEINDFIVPTGSITTGQAYGWAEIMGEGMFDEAWTAGSPGNSITNIQAWNVGVKFKPFEALAMGIDVWGAELAEDNAMGEDSLGIELDFTVSYKVVEGLNLDMVAAVLFAGDATYTGVNEADPYEIGARLSLSF